MLKNLSLCLLVMTVSYYFASCSSSGGMTDHNSRLKSFDVYDQNLESLLETVATHYDLDLDFDVDANDTPYSLSVANASIFDVLEKISSVSGYKTKVIDGEIVIQNEYFDEDMTHLTLTLNKNLWRDIRSVSKSTDIDEDVVKNFFGPLFYGVEVSSINAGNGLLELYLPKKNIQFIKKSLFYLNYIHQQRNLAVTLFVIKKENTNDFLAGNGLSKNAEFAWKLNAGDNLSFKNDKGVMITIKSQLLSEADKVSTAEVFLRLVYGGSAVEENFNFSTKPIQAAKLSDKLTLIVKSDWYSNGMKISGGSLNSNLLSSNSNTLSKELNTTASFESRELPYTDISSKFNLNSTSIRFVSMTSGSLSDISTFKVKTDSTNYSLAELLETISSGKSKYFVDKSGVLIDCQGTISRAGYAEWSILNKPLDTSFYRFRNGAFVVNKEGYSGRVQYFPTPNALAGFINSNVIK